MGPEVAYDAACVCHVGQRTRFGDPTVIHVEHVANAVAPGGQAVAWLHELFEMTSLGQEMLRVDGVTALEVAKIGLLTHTPTQPCGQYISRIAHAPGRPGELTRVVKPFGLGDPLGQPRMPPGAPPYTGARRCVLEQREVDGLGSGA